MAVGEAGGMSGAQFILDAYDQHWNRDSDIVLEDSPSLARLAALTVSGAPIEERSFRHFVKRIAKQPQVAISNS